MPRQLANQLLDHKSVAHEILKQAHVSSCKCKPDRAQRSEMNSTIQCCEGDMSIMNALASVAVNDLNSAVEWYEKVLGKPPDSRPMPAVAEWKFERGGWLQLYELQARAGSGSVTLAVSSIDDQAVQLKKLGIDTGQKSSGGKIKTLMITDTDGNHIAFAEAIDPNMAR
jgi:predicted enzyme related to lactoylglutathione lyase